VRGRKKKKCRKMVKKKSRRIVCFFSYSFGVINNSKLAFGEGHGEQGQHLVHIQVYILQIQKLRLMVLLYIGERI